MAKYILVLLVAALGGCTSLRGYHHKIGLTSDPSDLEVYAEQANGRVGFIGRTPFEAQAGSSGECKAWVVFNSRVKYIAIPEVESFHITAATPSIVSDLDGKENVELFRTMATGHIQNGFSKEMVVKAWGRPSSTSSHSYGNSTTDIWIYNRKISASGIATAWQTVTLQNGAVTGWSNTDLGH